LTEDGYIVKVIQAATNTEFELCDGRLCPTPQGPSSQSDRGPSSHGMNPAFA
jgi:hypothetical protein